jgi:hypothetical protein
MRLSTKAKLVAKRAKRVAKAGHIPLEAIKHLEQEQKPIAGQKRQPPAFLGIRLSSPRHTGAKVWHVTTKVVGSQAMIDARDEREALRLENLRERRWASKMKGTYGTIKDLRGLLGLPPPYTSGRVSTTPALPEDALIVSFDTEIEQDQDDHLHSRVVEVGVTVLDTREIIDTAPGPFARDWIAKAKTHHYVLDTTRKPARRMRACYFGDDMFGDVSSIRSHLLDVLQRLANPPRDPKKGAVQGPRKVVLVGHSVMVDIGLLRCAPLRLDFLSEEPFLIKPTMSFDTCILTDSAINKGAAITSSALGKLVCHLGIPTQYQQNGRCIGWHNAGNDSAYTMMALLIYAVRWESIILGKYITLSPEDLDRARDQRLLRGKRTPVSEGLVHRMLSRWKDSLVSSVSQGLLERVGQHLGLRKLLSWVRRT